MQLDGLQCFFDTVKVGIVVCSGTNHHVEMANETFARLHGCARQELVGMPIDEIFNRESVQHIHKQANDDEEGVFETFHRRKNGTLLPVSVHSSIIKDAPGATRRRIINVFDMTQQGGYEKLLHQMMHPLSVIVNSIPDLIWLKNPEGIYLSCNHAFERFFDVREAEIIGKTDYDFMDAHEADICHHSDIQALEKDEMVIYEERLTCRRDSITGVHEIRKVPVYDSSGSLIGVLGMGHDITKHKASEQQLQQALEFNREMINAIPDLLFELDKTGNYLAVFAHDSSLLALEKTVLPGKNIRDVLAPDSVEVCLQTIHEVDAAGQSFGNIMRINLPAGEKWFELSASKRASSGTYIMLSRDITERKRAEEVIRLKSVLLQSVLESSPDVSIFALDSACNYIAFNQNHRKVIHEIWGHEIAIGMNMLESITREDDKQKAKEFFDKALAGECFVNETQYGDAQLCRNYWQTYYAPIIDDNAKITGLTCFNLDITDKREREERLAAKERELRSLADSSPGMMGAFHMRPDGSIYMPYVSPNITDLFGLTPDDVLQDAAPLIALNHPDDAERVAKSIAESAQSMSTWHEEYRIIHPHKGERWMESNTMPQPHPQGGILWYGYVHDITVRKQMELEIRKQKDLQNTLLENISKAGLGVHLVESGRYIYTNDMQNAKKYGYDETFFDSKPDFLEIIHPDEQAKVYDMHRRRLAGEDVPSRYELNIKTVDGYREHSVSIVVVPNTDPIQTVVVTQDISERKLMAEKLKSNEIRLKEAQEISKIGSWEFVFSGSKLTFSDEMYRIFEIEQRSPYASYEEYFNTIHPEDRLCFESVFDDAVKNRRPYEMIYRLLMRDGRIKYIQERGKIIDDEHGEPVLSVGTVQDITEQKKVEQKIEHMAHHDALTGLPNRILAQKRTAQVIAQAKRNGEKAALLYIDLDGFKAINDSMGHTVGDAVLKVVTSRLADAIGEADAISRHGGDEFLLILPEIKERATIAAIAEKLLCAFEESFCVEDRLLCISASIGIALYPDHGETFESLLRNADMAMYKVKEQGKNNYCFYAQHMHHDITEQFRLQNDLKSALRKDEFVLYYQPQIDLTTNRVIGAEALIRWRHPVLGMVAPMQFIPIAESSGQIVQIGQWVIEEACRQASVWHHNAMAISVAVNISAVQFKRGNLEKVVRDALSASKLDPEYLELELTESIMMHDVESALQTVHALKALGVKLSIDDFGTGYSSLAYLKRFAFDKLKIDQSFVRDILSDAEDAAIVKTIIQMAHCLNLHTIAEGVESQEISDAIQAFGCNEVQGYHFAKPMEISEFESYFISRPRRRACLVSETRQAPAVSLSC